SASEIELVGGRASRPPRTIFSRIDFQRRANSQAPNVSESRCTPFPRTRDSRSIMMKITFLTMAAVAALSAAVPAAAQGWQGNQSQSAELQMQIDDGVRSGAISRDDTPGLRDGLRQLVALERRFSAGGISRRE